MQRSFEGPICSLETYQDFITIYTCAKLKLSDVGLQCNRIDHQRFERIMYSDRVFVDGPNKNIYYWHEVVIDECFQSEIMEMVKRWVRSVFITTNEATFILRKV